MLKKLTLLFSLMWCVYALQAQNPTQYKTHTVPLDVKVWCYGQFPEFVTEQNINSDISELIKLEYGGGIPIASKDQDIGTFELRIMIESNEVDSCNSNRLSWDLVVSKRRVEGPLSDGPIGPPFERKHFAHAFGKGASYLIRGTILLEVQRYLAQSYECSQARKAISIDKITGLESLVKPDVNMTNEHGALVRGGWRTVKTPPVLCTPRAPDYPQYFRSIARDKEDEIVTLSVITDVQGRPYRALGVNGPRHLYPTASEWVLGWLFDLTSQRTNECNWYEFQVQVRFIIEPSDMPGPIASRPGCIIGRKTRTPYPSGN